MHKYSKVRGILRAKQGSQIPKFFLGNIISNPYKEGSMVQLKLDEFGNNDIFNNLFGSTGASIIETTQTGHFGSGEKDKKSIFTNIKGKIGNTLKNGIQKLGTDGIINGVDASINLIGGLFNDLADNKISKYGNAVTGLLLNTGIISGPLALALKGFTAGFLGLDSLTGKNTIQMLVDLEANEVVGGTYQGSINGIAEASRKSGVKHGGITGNKKRRADNAFINEYQRLQNIISGIAEDALNQRAMVNDLNYIGYYNNINNVLDLRYMRAAKLGMKLLDKINLVKSRKFNLVINIDTKLVEEFKEGGVFPSHVDNSSINYSVYKLEWEPIIDDIADYWEPVIDDISRYKEGGKTKEQLDTPEIEKTSQKNLIPEGALHKNKHHIEHTEGLTLKGIPVIDNEGEQLAEIELDEIIFTLEVTKKLEELYKENTDESAIEAGKLLVNEILFNTDDRTGLISKCEKGGKL